MRAAGLDAFVVTHLPNIRYLSGLSSSAGLILITESRCTLVADFRYAAAAQSVVDTVAAAGIRAVLNFSPGTVRVPDGVKLKSMDLTVSLESLSFFLAQSEEPA